MCHPSPKTKFNLYFNAPSALYHYNPLTIRLVRSRTGLQLRCEDLAVGSMAGEL